MNDSYSKLLLIRVLPGVAVGLLVSVGQFAIAAGLATAFLLLAIGERR